MDSEGFHLSRRQ
uniref:Uncharacterized protein n=1 Tax=Anguilla anguilla TaxID=7936 RepID=A0A0E9TQ59_ANGAN